MPKELLSNYKTIKKEEQFGVSGINGGIRNMCVGKGFCPKPFDNIIGYHVEGVDACLIADNDIKVHWEQKRIFRPPVDCMQLTNRKTGEEYIFDCINGQFYGQLDVSSSVDGKALLLHNYYTPTQHKKYEKETRNVI